jgi:hypothetical protein
MREHNSSDDYKEGYFKGIRDIWLLLMELADSNVKTIEYKIYELKELVRKSNV